MKTREYFESYTNIAYALAGLAVLLLPNHLKPEYRLVFCLGMQALSSGSFVYHFVKTKPIYLFDWWAMCFLMTIGIGVLADNQLVWLGVILWQFVYSYFIMDNLGVYIEVALSAVPLLIAIFIVKSLLSFGIILGLFIFAIWLRSKDPDPRQATFHDSWQHGVWHILTAIGFSFIAFLP